ncbi:Methyltransferase domain-containing protein [Pleurostoma richardsiae]|uniref:Methyltransferase domain-containing protein n=1 Tax=Pleurostoma richardsiae TaxID=41990 RepID=A0AA38R7R3_9PEZI|nr:Methyltransferase domain-containing protein [Pleurostoma richardsiae]
MSELIPGDDPEPYPSVATEDGEATVDHLAPDNASTTSANATSEFSFGLAVDPDAEFSDVDSSLGDMDRASSSMSVDSSVYKFVEKFGRTFHKYKEGQYYMPNDEQEQNRLNFQHVLATRVLNGRLYLAPVQGPHRVLDMGTGTGIWAIDFAEQNEAAVVTGTDLSPIQPAYVPPNCCFEIDDIEDEWAWTDKFDYIHGRYITPFLKDVPKMLRNAYDNLNPGGWFEVMEGVMWFHAVDDTLKGTNLQAWNKLVVDAVKASGHDLLMPTRVKDMMAEAGFVNVTQKKIPVPMNHWAKGTEQKIIGAMQMTNLLEILHGITMPVMTTSMGWSPEKVEELLAMAKADIRDTSIHAYIPL